MTDLRSSHGVPAISSLYLHLHSTRQPLESYTMVKEDVYMEPDVLAKVDSGQETPVYTHKEYESAREAAEAGHVATDR